MKAKKFALTMVIFQLFVFVLSAQENNSVKVTFSNTLKYSNYHGIYAGFGNIRSGFTSTRPTFNVGYFNELSIGKTSGLLLSANILNSTYEISSNQIGLVPPVHEYSLQLSLTAEPRIYLSKKFQIMNSSNNAFHTGWFTTLPFEVNSSILTSSNPFAISLFLGAAVGYRHAISENFFLEAIGGMGETYNNLVRLQTTPYLRLKACYMF